MFTKLVRTACLASAVAFLGSALCAAPDLPPVGTEAPEIEAATWFNHVGKNPDLESLRGRAILIEFWATW